ncbi:hypothetical protein P3801_31685 [Pseudomonas aeruginosa]|uniref:hypothetical protein n=1 Tax=Pseudomonas aeruginosa TaxID=287 RepID=UPI00071B3BEB|nr:hypothetical protein [Pseudomonas aeruginosa]KSG63113.1 hypothetical protein AO959_26065 [Pseudomonas aeruginosa]MCV0209296.1 hypothetical protein [Pseudomonas aeruginosa]MDG3911066.1 hypothetical protein [Pseudomonas aeruginosa]MDP5775904.1 hypothetical protein [Pseudomonas aeruginosa]MDV7967445.1 hypothetical protein [Pseudomonas aeruginosa]
MKSIYNTPGFSEELLLVCASLREVGLDNLADQFRDAVFDRSVVDQAIIALRERVKTPSPEHAAEYCDWQARQTAYRLLQRLERATR